MRLSPLGRRVRVPDDDLLADLGRRLLDPGRVPLPGLWQIASSFVLSSAVSDGSALMLVLHDVTAWATACATAGFAASAAFSWLVVLELLLLPQPATTIPESAQTAAKRRSLEIIASASWFGPPWSRSTSLLMVASRESIEACPRPRLEAPALGRDAQIGSVPSLSSAKYSS